MDVTFTNVLEGARQYFQGLPMGSSSTASPLYQLTPEVQRTNNEATRNQEVHQSSNSYWMGQSEPHLLPSREPTPTQRPPSYNSDSSRPSSHSLYVSTSHDATTPSYSPSYQDQPSVFPQQHRQQNHQLQQHQLGHRQQQQPQQVIQQQAIQQPQQQQQQNNRDFQFTRPHFRDAPSNLSHHYSSHIQQSSAYQHSSPSPHNSASPQQQTQSPQYQPPSPHHPQSPKQQRKIESNVNLLNSSQITPIHNSTNYSNYQQSRTYYPTISYTNIQTPVDDMNYSSSHGYHYQQSAQVNDYYKNVYPSQSNSSSVLYNSSTVTNSSNPDQDLGVTYNQSLRTHNLPPIAQLSENYTKNIRDSQKQNISRSSTHSNVLSDKNSHMLNTVPSTVSQPPHQEYKIDYQFQNRVISQQYLPCTSSVTATSTSYNTVTTSRNNTFTVQTLSSSAAPQYNSKVPSQNTFNSTHSGVNVSQQSSSSISNNISTNDRKKLAPGSKHKRESPLDLSVKTVRTSADSTLDDAENERAQYYATNRIPPMPPNNYSSYDSYSGSYQRGNPTQRIPATLNASAPKVDFLPNFNVSVMGNTQQSYRPDQRPSHNRSDDNISRHSQLSYENSSSSALQKTSRTSTANRYPVVSVPTITNVNSYMQSQPNDKNNSKVLPRIDFPTVGHSLKNSGLYPSYSMDTQKKRPADTAPSIAPKLAKTETWRQTIDQQIEQKLSMYKQVSQSSKQQMSSKFSLQNGNYNSNGQDRTKNVYSNYERPQYPVSLSSQQPFNMNQYNSLPTHSQTYVPTPADNQYGANSNYLAHNQNSYGPTELNRSSSTAGKAGSGGAADKRVLTLLRNSIETKGVKEAQRKNEQKQVNKYVQQPHHRSDIQHPSTHVTAPLQPKPAFISRQNVSPFTPNSLPEGNNTIPMQNKLHLPRAVDSINFEISRGNDGVSNKQLTDTVISDQNNPNGDLDGLAAFLAARIRTKAELKQVSPTKQSNNNGNNHIQNNTENHLRGPRQDNLSASFSSGSSTSISPPKLIKECQLSLQPRKRLFSRTEDEIVNPCAKGLPPRDKSGMRSSSETSVFDFPDSGSDGELPVLEMQSLNAMRKDRKSTVKQTSGTENKEVKCEDSISRPLSLSDDIFLETCDMFMDQLKAGIGKKRGRRKKPLEPDVLAKLETATKTKPIISDMKVKEEFPGDIPDGTVEIETSVVCNIPQSKTDFPSLNTVIISIANNSEDNLEQSKLEIKTELPDVNEETPKDGCVKIRKLPDELSDSDSETIKQLSNKLKGQVTEKSQAEHEVKTKASDLLTISTKPVKKPLFGDGSAFYPGWEAEVYKYKKSLRMPPSLIQVSRPPSSMRISTSLPDLDPYPCSPASSTMPEKDEDSKSMFAKIKSEPIDSDVESNSSFNLFNNKNNYDSEGSASIKSLPVPVKDSIVDKLLQKCGKRKKRKYRKKDDEGPKIIPKSENTIELLPTPGLEIRCSEMDTKQSVIKTESPILGFRKSTIDNFKDAFLKNSNNIVGMNEQFSTVILKSRTRKETRVMKQRATIKEVFGEDRPASAPPVTCIDTRDIKKEEEEASDDKHVENRLKLSPRDVMKNKFMVRGKTKNNLLKTIADKKLKTELEEMISDDKDKIQDSIAQSPSTLSEDLDSKSETPSIDGDDSNISLKKRGKFNKIRRKFSSGFDYIRKKKKQVKKENEQNEILAKPKRRDPNLKPTPESEQDIQKEIKSWVLNKGIGETHLHRSARLGYTDITAFCLERMDCSPSPRDNAGYTPLHEACSRGHLDIAKLLLMYGANVSESAKGGVRPLHEAVENGFVEIIRLLLSYGADPKLATYAGLTPLSLATDEVTKNLLQNHMEDLEGKSEIPWTFNGPSSCFDPTDSGCDVLSSPPHPDPPSEEEDIEFEVSESLLPNLYTLKGEAQSDRWILLQDLSNILKVKSRDALLKQLCPTPAPGTSSNYKNFLRELKMSDFLEQAHCCQFLNASEKINSRASKIALVKYTDKIRELLKIEAVVITAR